MISSRWKKYLIAVLTAGLGAAAVVAVFSSSEPPPGHATRLALYDGLAVGLLRLGIVMIVEFVVIDELVLRDVDTEMLIQKDGLYLSVLLGFNAVAAALCFL